MHTYAFCSLKKESWDVVAFSLEMDSKHQPWSFFFGVPWGKPSYRSCNLWMAHDVDQCRSMGDPTWSDFAKRWWLPGVEQGISTDFWNKTCLIPFTCSGNKRLAATGLEFTKIGSRCLVICVATVWHLFLGRSKKNSLLDLPGAFTQVPQKGHYWKGFTVYLIVLEISIHFFLSLHVFVGDFSFQKMHLSSPRTSIKAAGK